MKNGSKKRVKSILDGLKQWFSTFLSLRTGNVSKKFRRIGNLFNV